MSHFFMSDNTLLIQASQYIITDFYKCQFLIVALYVITCNTTVNQTCEINFNTTSSYYEIQLNDLSRHSSLSTVVLNSRDW